VHISAMSKTFIKDPREGGEVGRHRQGEGAGGRGRPAKRIALTLRLDDEVGGKSERPAQGKPRDISRASMTSSAPRKPQEAAGGGGTRRSPAPRRREKNGNGS